jgi:hypothetical protein
MTVEGVAVVTVARQRFDVGDELAALRAVEPPSAAADGGLIRVDRPEAFSRNRQSIVAASLADGWPMSTI